jgi:hypothetical protein
VDKVERAQKTGWAVVLALVLAVVGILGMVAYFMFRPEPARFLRVEMLTPTVYVTGNSVAGMDKGAVKIRTFVESPVDPECLVSTQYFIQFPDGSMWKMPGARFTTQGELKTSIYVAAIPAGSPQGAAWFFIRDVYNCGLFAQRVQSDKIPFVIGAPNA